MMYELWHIASGNLLEDFETESEALDAVRGYIEANGLGMIDELSLSAVPTLANETPGTLPPSLRGEALARRAGVAVDDYEAADAPGEQDLWASPLSTARDGDQHTLSGTPGEIAVPIDSPLVTT